MRGILALIIFDFLLTIPEEVTHIWNKRFTYVTVVYLLNRYSSLLGAIFNILSASVW